jgi:hypothetical protein
MKTNPKNDGLPLEGYNTQGGIRTFKVSDT